NPPRQKLAAGVFPGTCCAVACGAGKAVELYLTGRSVVPLQHYSHSPSYRQSEQEEQGRGTSSAKSHLSSSSSCVGLAAAPSIVAARRVSAVAVAALAAAVICAGAAAAAVYGDKTGWTVMGNPNYAAWAASKKFHVGDTVVFTYLKQFHNVMAVSKADYKNCDATKSIATWSTGNDSIVLNTTGHHYFLCGFPGHCAAGQKVDIRVAAASAAPSEAPSMAPAPASGSKPSGGAAAAPPPHGNAASKTVAVTLAASVLSLAAAVLA
ncbi:blue copper protein-like, partial [Phragmites australis]|uniref:blue copper protein-like n=1 Tax=Phragmites australis TaxID=29695 RepID=UPI002D794CE9